MAKQLNQNKGGALLKKFISDFESYTIDGIQYGIKNANADEAKVLSSFQKMAQVQLNNMHTGLMTIIGDRTDVLMEADLFIEKSGGQILLDLNNIDSNKQARFLGGIGGFFGGIFGGIFGAIKEIIIKLLECLGINLPEWLKCLIELICDLPKLLGGLFSN